MIYQDPAVLKDGRWHHIAGTYDGRTMRVFLDGFEIGIMERGGSIVNIVDVAGIAPFPKHRAYSSTQAALIELTRKTALELAPYEINVNGICPGTVLPPDHYSAETVARLAAKVPLGRIGRPEDVAQAALYLAQAAYVTGQILAVDGGYCLAKKTQTGTQRQGVSRPRQGVRSRQ